MVIPTVGYNVEDADRSWGGMGTLRFAKSPSHEMVRLIVHSITGTEGVASYISLGGFRIGTEIFSKSKILHVYQPSLTTDDIVATVWEGIPMEVSKSSVGSMLICTVSLIDELPLDADRADNGIFIGGAQVSKNIVGHLFIKDMGTPEEEKEAMIGNRLLRVGRFGDVWALGIIIVEWNI